MAIREKADRPHRGAVAPAHLARPRRRACPRYDPDPPLNPATIPLNPATIRIGDDRRPVDPAAVAALVASFQTLGQLQPITVRASGTTHELVAGAHRLAAARELGWHVNAIVTTLDDDRAALAEIDENLTRSELSPAQRAKAIGDRKAIYERLHPETKAGTAQARAMNTALGNNVSDNVAPTFSADTAAKTGRSERDIQRDAKRAQALGSDLDKVARTALDTGTALDKLAAMDPAERAPIIAEAQAGNPVSLPVTVPKAKPQAKSDLASSVDYEPTPHSPPLSEGARRVIGQLHLLKTTADFQAVHGALIKAKAKYEAEPILH